MLKKLKLTLILVVLSLGTSAQEYHAFPTDTASWNGVIAWSWIIFPNSNQNYTYLMQGDTIIEETSYKKVFFKYTDDQDYEYQFVGGLREDSLKNIYYYPVEYSGMSTFPAVNEEYMLYSFANLTVGSLVPAGWEQIEIIGIDSILVGDSYRKRYAINQPQMITDQQYWIEGIGSDKDLLAPFSAEFEWSLWNLCYSDTEIGTHHFQHIDQEFYIDSCMFYNPNSVLESSLNSLKIFPNPAQESATIESEFHFENGQLQIYNSQGELVVEDTYNGSSQHIEIGELPKGLYFVVIGDDKRRLEVRMLKE